MGVRCRKTAHRRRRGTMAEENKTKQQIHGADVQMNSLRAESSLNQEIPETPQIKEEPEEQSIKQEEDQLQEYTAISVKSEEQSSLLEHRELTQGEDCGGTVQNYISCKAEHPDDSSSDTDNSEDWDPPASSSTQQMETEVDGKVDVQNPTLPRPYSCSVCEKTFIRNRDLKTHMRIHTGERPYSCPFCEKKFTLKRILKKHRRIHTGEKPYSCTVCEKTFLRNSDLKVHMRTHTGEKPYSCPFCNKTFTQKSHVRRHIRIHTGEKPYSCSVCKKTFTVEENLKTHEGTHRRETRSAVQLFILYKPI